MNGDTHIAYPFSGTQVVIDMEDLTLLDTVSLISFTAGPAGFVTSEIGDGISVLTDFADPGRLCRIDAPPSELNRSGGLVDELIGPEGRRALIETINSPNGPSLRRVELGPSRRGGAARSGIFGEGTDAAGRILAALDVSDDIYEHPLVRAVARIEVYSATRSRYAGAGRIISDQRLDDSLGYAFAVLEDDLNNERVLTRLSQRQYRNLVEMIDGESPSVRGHALYGSGIWSQIQLLGEHLHSNNEAATVQPRDISSKTPLLSEPVLPAAADDDGHPGATPRDGRGRRDQSPTTNVSSLRKRATPTAGWTPRLTGQGRLEVAFPKKPDGGWVKIFDANLAPIAVVPVKNHGRKAGGWLAKSVIPHELGLDDLRIAVIDGNDSLPSDPFERIAAAVEAGQDATRLEMAGRSNDASAQWRVCQEQWENLGDKTRANMAAAYADGQLTVTRLPQLHDTVRSLI